MNYLQSAGKLHSQLKGLGSVERAGSWSSVTVNMHKSQPAHPQTHPSCAVKQRHRLRCSDNAGAHPGLVPGKDPALKSLKFSLQTEHGFVLFFFFPQVIWKTKYLKLNPGLLNSCLLALSTPSLPRRGCPCQAGHRLVPLILLSLEGRFSRQDGHHHQTDKQSRQEVECHGHSTQRGWGWC